jgi:hypothetical protein
MRAGAAGGVVQSSAAEPGALAPDGVKGGWQAWDGKARVAAPALRVRPWTAEDKAAVAERARLEEAEASQAAEAAGDLVVDSAEIREEGTHARLLGRYCLQHGKMVARRPVWLQEGGAGAWLYYAPTYSQWFFSDEADMEAGATSGWMYRDSTELTPERGGGGCWRVAQGPAKETCADAFIDKPGAAARPAQDPAPVGDGDDDANVAEIWEAIEARVEPPRQEQEAGDLSEDEVEWMDAQLSSTAMPASPAEFEEFSHELVSAVRHGE